MKQQDFQYLAKGLVNKDVEVITSDGSYTGKLLYVGSDSLVIETRMRGRLVRLAIRTALIIALFALAI